MSHLLQTTTSAEEHLLITEMSLPPACLLILEGVWHKSALQLDHAMPSGSLKTPSLHIPQAEVYR